MTDLENKIGQLIMMGLAGYRLSRQERKCITAINPAGVTYFRRNINSYRQISKLSASLYDTFKTPPLIAIDQEGGKVARLTKKPFTVFPGNSFLGDAFLSSNKVTWTRQQTQAMATELRAIGVNLNFAPVIDINSNPKNPIIGTRAFSTQSKVVAKLGAVMIREFTQQGIISCAKHFPGHGDTFSDSHKVLPRVQTSKRTLMQRELLPFKAAIQAKVPTIMTAHVVYKNLDPKNTATLSPYILQKLLREKLSFKGIIISDDLEMNAISKKMNLVDAALLALEAGANLLLVCKSLEQVQNIYEGVLRATLKREIDPANIYDSLSRIELLKKKFVKSYKMPQRFNVSWPKHEALAKRIENLAKN